MGMELTEGGIVLTRLVVVNPRLTFGVGAGLPVLFVTGSWCRAWGGTPAISSCAQSFAILPST